MDNEFPPKRFAEPEILARRPEKGRIVPLTQEQLTRRVEVARVLGVKVESLNRKLKTLSTEERKAIFYKVTHSGPVNLSGTGLKPLVDRSENVTLAVLSPRAENLDGFEEKLQKFGTDEPNQQGMVGHQDYLNLEDVLLGEPTDRLSEELFSQYESLVQTQQPEIICEIELLSLAQGPNQRRDAIRETLEDINSAFASGIHGTLFEHEVGDGICRAVIRCTGEMFRRLVEEPQWQKRISWFEPKPRFQTFHTIRNEFQFDKLGPIAPPDAHAPTICIIDSGVSSGNPFLEPVTREELLRSFLKEDPENPYDENGHGSGVASLAAYYALKLAEGEENTARAWIAGARILGSDNQIEEHQLLSKVITQVVETFVPLGVRIFNLSVGDLAKKWNLDNKRTQPRTSWTARTLDRLSRMHDIVFVVSTGNILLNPIRDYLNNDVPYPLYLCQEDSRILDPGQAGLVVSVGSIAAGTLVAQSPDTTIALDFEPSPFTRSGPGIKGETKPDLVEIGGNLVSDAEAGVVRSNAATNVVMASHQLSPATAHNFGTSFAAPRVAHKLAILLHELQELDIGPITAPLLKAFLVNSAGYPDLTRVKAPLDEVRRKQWMQVVGHGRPDSTKATECDDYSMLLFHQGELAANKVAFFDVPIPAVLVESSAGQRITVTVTHYPDVQKWGLESYFGIDLKWRMFRGDVDREQILDAMSKDEDRATDDEDETGGSVKDMVFEHKVTLRSRGAVQHDWFDWQTHKKEFSENNYVLAISANKRWGRSPQPTKFAVVIRIEDLGGTVPIYTEIATQVDALVQQQTEV